MILSAYFGVAGLSDVGYRFYYADETPCGSRITAGVLDAGDGWYSVAAPLVPATATSVRWDSLANPTYLAREYLTPAPDVAQIADEVLTRDWTLVTGEAASSVLNALRSIRNKWTLDIDGTLTVYEEDGTTVAWTRVVTSDRTAAPVTGMS